MFVLAVIENFYNIDMYIYLDESGDLGFKEKSSK